MKTMIVVAILAVGELLAVLLAGVMLSSCAQFGPTEGQIKAMENTSSSFCVHAPGWNGSPIDAHYSSFGGKSTGTAGGGGKATCGNSTVEFTNEGKLPTTPKVSP